MPSILKSMKNPYKKKMTSRVACGHGRYLKMQLNMYHNAVVMWKGYFALLTYLLLTRVIFLRRMDHAVITEKSMINSRFMPFNT